MCGPLVLAAGSSGGRRLSPIAGGVAYNLGRIVTYSLWGLVFGLVGKSLAFFGVQRWISITVGAILLLTLLVPLGRWRMDFLRPAVDALKHSWARVLRRASLSSMALLGMINGLLPCGLVYTAGGAAAVMGGWWEGVEYMALFGLGTVPMMLSLGIFGRTMPFALRLRLQRLTPLALGLVAVLLIVRGLGLGIPYLSPSYADGACHCH